MENNASILVVEDDESMLDFCSTVLSLDGFQVSAVSNGYQAISRLKAAAFDVVLTDHVLVPPEGRSMTHIVKSLRPEAEVIVMTGLPSFENAVLSFSSGACDYLVKPFKLNELTVAIRRCLERKKTRLPESSRMDWLKAFLDDFFSADLYGAPSHPPPQGADEKLIALLQNLAFDYKKRMTLNKTLPLYNKRLSEPLGNA